MRKLIYIAIGIFILTTCGEKNACFKGEGKTETKTINDLQFDEISLHDNIDIEIKYGTVSSVTIETGKNLIPFIETNIINGVLTLKNNNKCDFLRNQNSAVKVIVTSPNISHITYYGIGNIWSSDTLFYPEFEFDSYEGMGDVNLILNSDIIEIKEHIGSCDVTISGKSNSTYLYLTTFGNFYCKDLISKNVHVNNYGHGEINLFALNELKIEKRKTGNINYWGNPFVTILVNEGTGSINKK